jgi:hypothetical protein
MLELSQLDKKTLRKGEVKVVPQALLKSQELVNTIVDAAVVTV